MRCDGEVRWLRETSFPIRDAQGEVVRIGGIAEVLTRHDGKQVYLVGSWRAEERRLRRLLRAAGLRVRTFTSADAFLEIAPFLGPGCVLVDLRRAKRATAMITRELRARSIPLKAVLIGPDDGGVAVAVDAMKSGAADYLQAPVTDEALMASLASIAPEAGAVCDEGAVDGAAARLARRTPASGKFSMVSSEAARTSRSRCTSGSVRERWSFIAGRSWPSSARPTWWSCCKWR